MKKKVVKLSIWVHYDSETGYVWPQVYGTKQEAHLDEKMNAPIKVMKLSSKSYSYDPQARKTSGSFGTETDSGR